MWVPRGGEQSGQEAPGEQGAAAQDVQSLDPGKVQKVKLTNILIFCKLLKIT